MNSSGSPYRVSLWTFCMTEIDCGQHYCMTKKKPLGRPKLDAPRYSVLSVRLSAPERTAVDAAAKCDGEKPTAWARKILLIASNAPKRMT